MASAKIVEICGKNSAASPPQAASDWVYALKDVSFEVKRGELRTPGRSEKEISKKCLGATKVPDSGRRRHQCLGLIGHNRAGFNPILTGCSRRWTLVPRLLLSINGSVLGLTKKENDAKIDEIIDFAEIREAIGPRKFFSVKVADDFF